MPKTYTVIVRNQFFGNNFGK